MTELTLPWPPKECSPNARGHWSQQEDEALTEYIEAGATVQEIAQASGRTAGGVRNRAWRLGLLASREWSPEQIEALREGYQPRSKISIEALCKKIGKSAFAVYIKASRIGLGDPCRPVVDARKEKVRKFETAEALSKHMSDVQRRLIAERGHPRHMLGKKHSDTAKALISQAVSRMNAARTDEQKIEYLIKATKTKIKNGTLIRERPNTSWKAAWREIGGRKKYYRSKWEANYAYYLEWLKQKKQIASWSHEPTTFWFEGVKRGCVSYLPDFHVVENDGSEAYHEVKGWMDARSKTKIRRMAKYHPSIKLIVIDSKAYERLRKTVSGLVPGWEP